MNDFLRSLQHMHDLMARQCAELKAELAKLPEYDLYHTVRNGSIIYYKIPPGAKTAQRTSINNDPKLIDQLIYKKYLEEKLLLTQQNLNETRKLLGTFVDLSPDRIISNLSAHDQKLPFWKALQTLSPAYKVSSQVYPSQPFIIDPATRARIDSHRAWAEGPYPQSTYKPERKNKLTSRGLKVRSRGEGLICEDLYQYEVPFRYEQIILFDGIEYAPDFSFLDRWSAPLYLEYFGMMDNEAYVERHIRKLIDYERMGIVPWKNLFVIYTEGDQINMQEVDSLIRYQLIPRM